MKRREVRHALWLVVLHALLAAPSQALAYEDQETVGPMAGYSGSFGEGIPASGAMGGIHGSIGLNDIWSLRGHLAYGIHPGSSASRTAHFVWTGIEAVYLLDIVELVPFLGAGASALAVFQSDQWGIDPAVHGVVGVDYLLSRDHLVGLDVRPYLLPIALRELSTDPLFVTVNLRFEWVFGW